MKSFRRLLAPPAIALALAIALVGWLALVRWDVPTVVDGYPIGVPARCADGCPLFRDAASAWLDTAHPGHSRVDRIDLFVPNYRDRDGNVILMNRSGGTDYIAVIHLADGSVRAIQVGCGVGIDPERCFTSQPMTFP